MSDAARQAGRLIHRLYLERYPGEAARKLERLPAEQIAGILDEQTAESAATVWELLSPDVACDALGQLAPERSAAILSHLDPARCAVILAAAEPAARQQWLQALPLPTAAMLETLLRYPANTAGALMDPRVVLFRRETRVREAVSRLRPQARQRRVGHLYLADDAGRLDGVVEIHQLALARHADRLGDLAGPPAAAVASMTPREDLLELIQQQRLSELAVLDGEQRLVGVIRADTLLEATREEATLDIQTMVGVSKEERALSPASLAVRKRLPWLHINLVTAFLAASVVGLFEHTIAQVTALAVLMPVVAGMAGNTGQQALAVTMRGLALREIRVAHWPRVLGKECGAGLVNGVLTAMTTSLGVYLWSGSGGLALVIALAMVLSMLVAVLAGTLIPIVLTALRQDPAQASSIFLTTLTDVAGFFSFLGIATVLAAML